MASGTAPTTVTPPPVAEDRRTVQVIERQLGRARFHVKLVDFLCHLAILLVGTLVYLLVAAVADHWLLPGGLGFTGRTIAFLGLIALAVWFVIVFLGPLVLHGINPTYAARAIEEAQPSLKNSLINFLLLRHDRGGIREAVFEAVEQKAASDIAKVQVESAVDRSPMIRVGYVLVGVLVLCAAYKILSPKDPFQTAARVALPWADIARPSRVQILDVKPGSAKVYHGHTAAITATIEGTSEDSPVWLVYSTADGQTIDRKLRMNPRPGGVEFQVELPPQSDESPAIKPGLQQDVIYRVEAGDAISPEYRLSVVAAPTIVVQQLQYDFPAYTLKPRQTHDKQGDIQALEGTKVTIFASANQPIQSAYLELDPNDSAQGAGEIVPLTFEGQRAWGTITLALAPNRVTPWRTSYHVRFVNEDGNKSEQPIRHQIDVQRDLPPEVQILAPIERRIEVPENGSRPIEVRAVDPDFGLTRLALLGEVAGKEALAEELLKASADGKPTPQAVAKYVFVPQKLGLKAGDELVYVATAADNRASAAGSAEPDVATTGSYVIVIVPPVEQPQNPDQPLMENEQPMAGENKPPMPMDDQRQPMNDKNDQPKQDEPQQGEKQGTKSEQPMKGEQQPKQGDNSQQQKQGKNEKGSSKSGDQKNQGDKGGGEKSNQEKSDGAEGSQQEDSQDQSEKGSKGQSQPGGSKGQKSSGNPEQESPADGAAGEPSQDGGAKGKPSGNAREPSGNQGESGDNTGDASGTSDQPAKPAHDGDAIERINQLRQEREQQSGQRGEKRDGSDEQPDGAKTPMQSDSTDGSKREKNSDTQQRPGSKQGEKTSGKKGSGEKTTGDKADGAKGENGLQGTEKEGTKGTDDEGSEGDPTGAKQGDKRGTDKGSGEKAKGGEGTKSDAAGAKGGNPQGPMKTKKADEPGAGLKGEKKEPGTGKNGDSGAGDASKNEKGSGDSQEANRDTKKEMGPDSIQPKESDPSTPSGSKKQSDSQGNDSGDKSGGGKSGAGQSSKQAGNDAAGSNSPGDEGAGAAKENGKGETGAKGGNQKKADGQTGAKGNEKGDGSGSKEGEGSAAGGQPMPPDGHKQNNDAKGSDSKGTGGTIPTGGGAPSERPPGQQGTGEVADSDDANLEYAKKQTDLALQYLKDQEHNPDPELLDRLGWSKEEMQEFLRRWEAIQKAAAEDPQASHELDESLRSLGLTPAKNRKRAGGKESDNTRDLRDSGGRSSAPKGYRDQFDSFRKGSR